MADRTVTLKIGADITDLQGKLRKASNDAKSFASETSRAIQKNRSDWSGLSTQVGLMGGAMVAAAGLAAKRFADFDKSMSKVKASGKDAADNITALRDAAVRAGADTQYSAGEAADAITDLAKAGVSAKDILGGGLSGALSLAAAGEMDVKEAAETTSVALTQFKLGGEQASHVADLLAAGAGKAMGEVSDLGMALRQGGLVANQTGLSIEETVGALSSFAAAGMLGSDAGTSLKTMLQRLTPQSKEAQAQFDKLGISAYDTSGEFVGLANFAGQLTAKMGKLSPQARNAAMSVMFGSDAVRAANVLYAEGQAGIQGWISQVNDAGFAARQAYILTDNLAGDIERLGGAMDTVFIQSGSGANKALRGLTQGAEAAVDAFGKLPEPILTTGALLTGSTGMGLAGAAGMMKLIGTLSDAHTSISRMGRAAKVAKIAVAGIGGALTLGTLALGAWASSAAEAKASAEDFASTMAVVGGKITWTDLTLKQISSKLTTRGSFFGIDLPALSEEADKLGLTMSDLRGWLSGTGEGFDRVNAAMDAHDNWTAWIAGGDELRYSAMSLRKGLSGLNGELTEGERVALQQAQATNVAGTSAGTYADALANSTEVTKEANTSLADYAKQLFTSANAALALSGSEIGWQAALDDTTAAIKKNGKAQRTATGELDLNRKKGRENQAQLDGLATSSVAYAQKLIEQGKSEETVQAEMQRSRNAFIKNATAAGMTKDAAKRLADSYGLIPDEVSTDVNIKISDAAIELEIVKAATKDLPAEQRVEVLSEYKSGGIEKAQQALDELPNSKNITITTKYIEKTYKTKAGTTYKAAGGAIFGPGTATSDSIPAMLSNNEHVWTAAEVRAAGGHGRVERLRALALSGDLPGFAGGGAVRHFASGGAAELPKVRASLPPLRLAVGGPVVLPSVDGPSVRTVSSTSSMVTTSSVSTTYSPNVNITNVYPVAEPASVATNRALASVAAIGRF